MKTNRILSIATAAAMLLAAAPLFQAAAQDAKPTPATKSAATKPAARPNPAFTPIEDEPGLPRVLLIGDSISIGYHLQVRALLKGKANVHRPPTNCGPTTNGVANLDKWLAVGSKPGEAKKWDVIHFNWGLHDLKHADEKGALVPVGKGKQLVPPEQYEKNLRELVAKLKGTGAKLIWCSTTPVPEGANGRVPADADKYNAIAKEVMKENNVAINDLGAFAKPKLAEIQRPKDVHYTAAGSKVLAEEVAGKIEGALGK